MLSTRIVKYRDLIGGYDSTAQLARVYGLPAETLTEILPYLHLSPKPEPTMLAQAEPEGTRKEAPVSEAATSRGPAAEATRPTTILDLNQADSLALVALPGIGPVLSARILKYRDKLGFFYAPEQLRMIYGLSEENYQRMRPYLKAGIPTDAPKLDLNTVNRYTLRYYPHLGEEGADRLLAHRRKLGRFGSWQEVAQCPGLTPEALVVLKAYFSL
ncbi:MAG: hypothetical protein D6722_10745 [Bacteroidetes bacterium]|nr:MAG: hypothetical protein D6722_10745 [Bacteroidota bacterium]